MLTLTGKASLEINSLFSIKHVYWYEYLYMYAYIYVYIYINYMCAHSKYMGMHAYNYFK